MPQRKSTSSATSTTPVLNISRDDFKTAISERIESGNELLKRNISSSEELTKLNSDYKIWSDYNFELLKQSFNVGHNDYSNGYNEAGFYFLGQLGEVKNDPIQSKKNLINYKLEELQSLLSKANLLKSEIQSNTPTYKPSSDSLRKNEVFIVHGHDDLAKTKTARFLEKLGLKPIILHEQSSSGRTIIEKIEEYSNVGFGIVLYTPCDLGSKKGDESNMQPRARQNVIFEHGYLIGKIGRSNVCALVKNEVETPNDISGVVFVKMDDSESWHLQLARELKSSGYEIDMNKLY